MYIVKLVIPSQIMLFSLIKEDLALKLKNQSEVYSTKTKPEKTGRLRTKDVFCLSIIVPFPCQSNFLNFHYFPFSYSVLFHIFCYLSSPEVIWICNPSFKKLLSVFQNIEKCVEQIILCIIGRHVNSLQHLWGYLAIFTKTLYSFDSSISLKLFYRNTHMCA